MNDLATSKPTSIPTRSISSNGPMRKPPPSRQMRSICSCGATRSLSSRSPSAPNGRPQRFTRKPGPVGGQDHLLAHRLAGRRATASARSPVWSARITSSSRISGGGLKKCMPTTFSGRAAAPASEVTGIDEVLVASTASRPHTSDSRANSSRLSSGRSGRRLDHELTRPAPRGPRPARAALAALRRRRALLDPAREAAPNALRAALERLRHGVVEQRPHPGGAAELGDPGAHRPGADHAEDAIGLPLTARGTPACASRGRRSSPPPDPRWPSRARRGGAPGRARRRATSRPPPAPPACRAAPPAAAARHHARRARAPPRATVLRRHPVHDAERERLGGVDPPPVSTSSIARCFPITRVRRWVPPPPG